MPPRKKKKVVPKKPVVAGDVSEGDEETPMNGSFEADPDPDAEALNEGELLNQMANQPDYATLAELPGKNNARSNFQ
jgi:hypothetical protein